MVHPDLRHFYDDPRGDPFAAHESIKQGDLNRLEELCLASHWSLCSYNDTFLGYPLHFAIYYLQPTAVKILVRHGADILAKALNELGQPNHTPLQFAAQLGELESFNLLWEEGAARLPVSVREDDRHVALEVAAGHGSVEVVSRIVRSNNHWPMETTRRALLLASRTHQAEVVHVLTQNVDYPSAALDEAFISGCGVHVHLCEREGMGPGRHRQTMTLRWCATLTVLLDAGADINATAESNREPATNRLVLFAPDATVMDTILTRGANANAQDNYGSTALHVLCRSGHRAIGQSHLSFFKTLLQHGASWEILDKQGRTPFDLALTNPCPGLIQQCLDLGAFHFEPQEPGETILHAAAADGHLALVKSLVEAGHDVSACTASGWSPLLCAATPNQTHGYHGKQLDIIRYLLANGASFFAELQDGWTVIHALVALNLWDEELALIVEALICSGAQVGSGATIALRHQPPTGTNMRFNLSFRPTCRIPSLRHTTQSISAGEEHCTRIESQTPLHIAAALGHFEVVKVLLKHGADPRSKNGDGQEPAHEAAYSVVDDEVYTLPKRIAMLHVLLEAGASLDAMDKNGRSVQAWADGQGLGGDWRSWECG